MPQLNELPAHEPRFEYLSIFHHMPLINGYSGYYPIPTFPDSIACAACQTRRRCRSWSGPAST